MSKKRKVRGLLDLLTVNPDAEGIEWEWDRLPFGPENMGLGFGATEQAKRWAWIGYNAEMQSRMDAKLKRPRGRPRKKDFQTKDAYRAFQCWKVAQIILSKHPKAVTCPPKLPSL